MADPLEDLQSWTTVESETYYAVLPYFGSQSEKLKLEMSKLINRYLPDITLRIVLFNGYKISKLFNFKDKVPLDMRTKLIYKYVCAKCASEYVGMTSRNFYIRICEHKGINHRTSQIQTGHTTRHNTSWRCMQDTIPRYGISD